MTPTAPDIAGPSVYIVEDDPDFGAYLAELVEDSRLGRVGLFQDGLSGLNACLRDTPNVVVLDLNLPLLRGEEICRLLRSSNAHRTIRIMIVSDMPEAQRRELELLQIGADVYFEKPFVEQAFLDDVTRLLGLSVTMRREGAPRTEPTGVEDDTPPMQRADGPPNSRTFLSPVPTERVAPKPPAEPKPPAPEETTEGDTTLFSGYQILDVIGGGAMGTVYRARQLKLGRLVALKVFLRDFNDDEDAVERFQREAVIMAQFNHPNIVQVYDTGNTGFTHYIAMELMEGGSLLDVVERNGPGMELLRRAVTDCGEALMYLHGEGVVHRDVKPANILCNRVGIFKIGDFGISRARLSIDRQEFTQHDVLMGTRSYMAPELLMGAKADARSDQFAFGRALVRLYEGEYPNTPLIPLKELDPSLPDGLCKAIHRCLAMDPSARYPSMKEARDAILAAIP